MTEQKIKQVYEADVLVARGHVVPRAWPAYVTWYETQDGHYVAVEGNQAWIVSPRGTFLSLHWENKTLDELADMVARGDMEEIYSHRL